MLHILKHVARLKVAVNAILFLMKKGRALNNLLLDPTGTWIACFGGERNLENPENNPWSKTTTSNKPITQI